MTTDTTDDMQSANVVYLMTRPDAADDAKARIVGSALAIADYAAVDLTADDVAGIEAEVDRILANLNAVKAVIGLS